MTFTEAPATGDVIEVRELTTTETITGVSNSVGSASVSPVAGSALTNVVGDLSLQAQADLRFADADSSNYVAFQAPTTVASNVTWTLPSADASVSGYALVSDASGTLSFAAAGATITSDTATNTDFLLYFGTSTSGALTAVKQDSGYTYNPSTGLVKCAAVTTTGDITVGGNLTVNGTTTTINTTNLAVSDAIIQCASGNSLASATYIGLQAERGVTDAYFVWEESSDRWRATTSTDGSTHTNADMQCGTLYGTATTANYADLAENYSADADYAPGTVVCFGGDAEVTQCNEDGDRRIAGVVSTDPAYLMNNALEGTKATVALTGRVPCMVTGSVKKGDMMVSAGNGMARAEADPKMGSVIGKALEDSEGDATIEVVVGRM
jgi:hypothetical protein